MSNDKELQVLETITETLVEQLKESNENLQKMVLLERELKSLDEELDQVYEAVEKLTDRLNRPTEYLIESSSDKGIASHYIQDGIDQFESLLGRSKGPWMFSLMFSSKSHAQQFINHMRDAK